MSLSNIVNEFIEKSVHRESCKESVILVINGTLIESWKKNSRLLAIINRENSSAFFIFKSIVAEPGKGKVIKLTHVVPINQSFSFKLEKSRSKSGKSIPVEINAQYLDSTNCQFELELHSDDALTLFNHIKRIINSAGINPPQFHWLESFIELICTASINNSPFNSVDNPSLLIDHHTPNMNRMRLQSLDGSDSSDSQFMVRKLLSQREDEYCDWVDHSVYVATWNVNGRVEDINIDSWLKSDKPPDFYVLGFQELELSIGAMALNKSSSSYTEDRWLNLINKSTPFQRTKYKLLNRARLSGILILVYAKKAILHTIKEAVSQTVPTGMFNVIGNKGAVGVSLKILDSTLCFVCCHLAAGEGNLERRNQDFIEITKKMLFEIRHSDNISINKHDLIFFFGDLNYRIIGLDNCQIKQLIKDKNYCKLLDFDELCRQRLKNPSYMSYGEQDITFQPTYKFDTNSDEYDSSEKNRTPSYCDRILWRGDRCRFIFYRSHMEFKLSDHKPLSSLFNIGVKRVDNSLFKETHESIIRDIDLKVNRLLPQAVVNINDINFGEVKFLEPKSASVTLTNTGETSFQYEFLRDDSSPAAFPKWLTIIPETKQVEKDESVIIKFEVYINGDSVSEFNSGTSDLNHILVLTLQGGKHIFLTTTGNFVPTCFGLPLSMLLLIQRPVRELLLDQVHTMFNEAIKREQNHSTESAIVDDRHPFTAPKELYRLIDYIAKNALQAPDLFEHPGNHREIPLIRESLDTTAITEPIPEVSIHSVVECLLTFINSLPNPVIPKAFADICYNSSKEGFGAVLKAALKMPADNRNCLFYVISFLKRVLEFKEENKSSPETLATIFAGILFKSQSQTRQQYGVNFVKCLLENDINDFIKSHPCSGTNHMSQATNRKSKS